MKLNNTDGFYGFLRCILFLYGLAYPALLLLSLAVGIAFQGFGQGNQVFLDLKDYIYLLAIILCHLSYSWYAAFPPRSNKQIYFSTILFSLPLLQSLLQGAASISGILIEITALAIWVSVIRHQMGSAQGTEIEKLFTKLAKLILHSFAAVIFLFLIRGFFYADEATVKKYLVGSDWKTAPIWDGIFRAESNIGHSGGEKRELRLESDGKAFENRTGIDYYKINGNVISTFKNNTSAREKYIPVERYKIASVNEKYLLLEFYDEIHKTRIIPEFIRYKRTRKFIDGDYFKKNPLFISNEKRLCDISYFGKENEYVNISTEACDRKKSDGTIHLDIPSSDYTSYTLTVGTWSISDNKVTVTARIADSAYGIGDKSDYVGEEINEIFETPYDGYAGSDNILMGMHPLTFEQIPQFETLRSMALTSFKQLPRLPTTEQE